MLQCSSAPVVQHTSQHQVSEQCPSNVVSAIGMQVVVAYSKITCVCVNGFGSAVVVQEFNVIKHPNERPNRVPFDCNIGLGPVLGLWTNGATFYIELGCGGDTKMHKTVILPVAFYALKLGPSHSAKDKASVFENRF